MPPDSTMYLSIGASYLAALGLASALRIQNKIFGAFLVLIAIGTTAQPVTLLLGGAITRFLFLALCIAGLAFSVYFATKHASDWIPRVAQQGSRSQEIATLPRIAISLLASMALLFPYFPSNHVFESHDLVYLGWITNAFEALPLQGVVLDVAWPRSIATSNSSGGYAVLFLLQFLEAPNLLEAQTAKVFLLFVTFCALFFKYLKAGSWASRAVVALVVSPLFISEIFYSLYVSNWVPVILLAYFGLDQILEIRGQNELRAWDAIWLLVLLGLCKSVLLPIAILTVATVFYQSHISWRRALLPSLVVFPIVLTWFLGPKSDATSGMEISLAGVTVSSSTKPLGDVDLQSWIWSFGGYPSWNVDYLISTLGWNAFLGVSYWFSVGTLIWMLSKSFLLHGLLFHLVQRPMGERAYLTPMTVWTLSSVLLLLFARVGENYTVAHVSHIFLIFSASLFFLVPDLISRLLEKSKHAARSRQLMGALCLVLLAVLPSEVFTTQLNQRERSATALTASSAWEQRSRLSVSQGFLDVSEVGYAKGQVIGALTGVRVHFQQNYALEEGRSLLDDFVSHSSPRP